MNSLTLEEKTKLVLDLVKKHNITAYEIGNNTELNTSSLQKLFRGEVDKPRNTTLNIILDYIEKRITGSNLDNYGNKIVSEPPPEYKKTSSEDALKEIIRQNRIVARLMTEIHKLHELLDSHKIKYVNCFSDEDLLK